MNVEFYILDLNLWEHMLFTAQPHHSQTERQHWKQANIHIASGAQMIEHTPDAVDDTKDSLTWNGWRKLEATSSDPPVMWGFGPDAVAPATAVKKAC